MIYGLSPAARSRVTTAYMVSVFLGGIGGSAVSAISYGASGWHGVCTAAEVVAAALIA